MPELEEQLVNIFKSYPGIRASMDLGENSAIIVDIVQAMKSHTRQQVLEAELRRAVFEIEQAKIVADTEKMTIKYMRGAINRRLATLEAELENLS